MDMRKQNRVTEPVPFLGGQVEGRPGNGEVGVSRSGRFLLGDRRDTVVGPGAGRVRLAEALVAALASRGMRGQGHGNRCPGGG